MKTSKNNLIGIGFSSIITVLVTICLVAFGALSVLTTYSDYKLSQNTAMRADAYYAADAIAREQLAAIDSMLFTLYRTTDSSSQYYQQILSPDFLKELPQLVSNLTVTPTETAPVLSYEVPVAETLILHVTLKIQYPQTGSECFTTITRWQTVTTN